MCNGWPGWPEFAWRTAVVRRIAGVQRGNGGSSQPRAWVQPPWSPRGRSHVGEPHQAGRDSAGEAHGPTRRGRNLCFSPWELREPAGRRPPRCFGGITSSVGCQVPLPPTRGRAGWGLSRAGGGEGWAQPDFWRVPCIPAWLNFSARCFLCLSDACEAAESASLSLCSLPSAICPSSPAPARPVAEAGGPHPPSPPSLLSCLRG